ncbi:DUF418 domain-containing protein [Bacillus thuringiensis]|uniref:DUF418 domain-containing protein n=2 Tax=Bacillus thuringiensis TaxID=1428 RepID=A0ABD6S2R2_BACTU|nr:DUF418 domain-containing protein [Bacillus thuringiensis]EEM38076.1 hypothetical protein bthur0004_60720 [Bacillus thuringiensis serovar sotto str. T04001]AFQ19527.1 hypothetical protein BTG_30943 [Bacillus thuringiensis HD-771]MEB4892258.1 DUF418 domain-containing protein [Bacillus thuringiensis]MEC2560728.1 DUF418 domain-containing protein [Bacillus thuringiensis]MEC2645833.1 DUF418 domain-containing protein [Bacillus thuringiensis]
MQQNARIHSLDIIRGIAILFILFANLPTMTGLDPFNQAGYSGTDKAIRFLVDLFIQAKFYTIFAFLFGVGFYIFMKNTEAKGYPMYKLFTRRLCILLIFGLLHFIFLWYGDILHAYALSGFVLLFFYKRSPKFIFIAGCCFLFVSYTLHAILFIQASSSISVVPSYYQYMFTGNTTNNTVNLFTHYLHQAKARLFFLMTQEFQQLLIGIPEYIGLFLIGLWAGKKDIFNRVTEFIKEIRFLQWSSLWISCLLSCPIIYYFINTNVYYSQNIQLWILFGGKMLAIFYICTLLRVCENNKYIEWLHPFINVGKYALTNYISQSILTLVILSLYFKDVSHIYYWQLCIFGILIIFVQIIFSKAWSKYFRYGPIEWIWRKGIYKR